MKFLIIILCAAVFAMKNDFEIDFEKIDGKTKNEQNLKGNISNATCLVAISSYSSLTGIIYYIAHLASYNYCTSSVDVCGSQSFSIPMKIAMFAFWAMMTAFFFTIKNKFQNEKLILAILPIFSIICFAAKEPMIYLGTIMKVFERSIGTEEIVERFIGPVLEEVYKFTLVAAFIKLTNSVQREENIQKYAKEIAIVVGATFDISETMACIEKDRISHPFDYQHLLRIFPMHTFMCLSPFYFFQSETHNFWRNVIYGQLYSTAIHVFHNAILPDIIMNSIHAFIKAFKYFFGIDITALSRSVIVQTSEEPVDIFDLFAIINLTDFFLFLFIIQILEFLLSYYIPSKIRSYALCKNTKLD